MFRINGWFSFSSIDLRISRDAGNLKEYFALEIELKNARILLRRPFGLFLCLICPERGRKSARWGSHTRQTSNRIDLKAFLSLQNFRDERSVVVYKISYWIRRHPFRSFNLDTGDKCEWCDVYRIDVFRTEIPVHDFPRSRRNFVFQLYNTFRRCGR